MFKLLISGFKFEKTKIFQEIFLYNIQILTLAGQAYYRVEQFQPFVLSAQFQALTFAVPNSEQSQRDLPNVLEVFSPRMSENNI